MHPPYLRHPCPQLAPLHAQPRVARRCPIKVRNRSISRLLVFLARQYVLEVLQEREEREALRQAVGALHRGLGAIRDDVAAAVEVLLSSAGKVTEADARSWVDENFK